MIPGSRMALSKATLLLLLACLPLAAQFSKLPSWTQNAITAGPGASAPEGAGAWILLDRTEFAYHGDGELRIRQFRLVKVLDHRGISEATFYSRGLGRNVTRIHKLKGWNLRPDGEMTKLDLDDVVTVDADLMESGYTTTTVSAAQLSRVVPGSYIAFESQTYETLPTGPTSWFMVMEPNPIRDYELVVEKDLGWFVNSSSRTVELRMVASHLDPWIKQREISPVSIHLTDVPALPAGEKAAPAFRNVLPRIDLAILDKSLTTAPVMFGWDDLATWTYKTFLPREAPVAPVPVEKGDPLKALSAIQDWMRKNLRYQQVYLTPERGWIPESSVETIRRRYGDCKDLTACFLGMARSVGLEGCPVLANLGVGNVEPDELPVAAAANHMIVAIALPASLGLAAEVLTPQGRFLLTDPTDMLTPIGWLGEGHRGGRLLICGPHQGSWVQVPESAIYPTAVRVRLSGDVGADGAFKGDLRIHEAANALGLRAAKLRVGSSGLDDLVSKWLGLPLKAVLQVRDTSDPGDLDKPFDVTLHLEVPDWMTASGGEWQVEPLGLPGVPSLIQKVGKPRILPVEVAQGGEWTWEADLGFGTPLVPVLPNKTLETPLRSVAWQARREGERILMTFHQTRHPATWNLEHREEGVAVQRKDRNELERLLEDMLSFRKP